MAVEPSDSIVTGEDADKVPQSFTSKVSSPVRCITPARPKFCEAIVSCPPFSDRLDSKSFCVLLLLTSTHWILADFPASTEETTPSIVRADVLGMPYTTEPTPIGGSGSGRSCQLTRKPLLSSSCSSPPPASSTSSSPSSSSSSAGAARFLAAAFAFGGGAACSAGFLAGAGFAFGDGTTTACLHVQSSEHACRTAKRRSLDSTDVDPTVGLICGSVHEWLSTRAHRSGRHRTAARVKRVSPTLPWSRLPCDTPLYLMRLPRYTKRDDVSGWSARTRKNCYSEIHRGTKEAVGPRRL
eukprot:3675399-Prymnesium_polylepis.2